MHENERKIVEYFKSRDRRAMELIYDHYAEALFGMAKRITGDEASAADVLQDACVKIWRKSSTYDASKGKLFTWMAAIVRNRAIDEVRKDQRSREIHREEAGVNNEKGAGAETSPALQHDLDRVMAEIDQEQRTLLEHSYILGYTHPEISEKFGIPLGTVKTKIRNAMIQLRKIFGHGR